MTKFKLRFLWIIVIVLVVSILANTYHKKAFPVFKIENMLFCVPNRIEMQNDNEDRDIKSPYQGLQGRYLGEIQKETNLPYFLLKNFEACNIPKGTKIYTVDIEQVENSNLSYYGLLLETANGTVYFAYPYIQNVDGTDVNSLKEQIISLFYSE